MQERRVPVRGGMFEAQVFTEGSGPPLLFLHSVPIVRPDAAGFERLTERFTVYAPMHPGFGGSTRIEQLDDILDVAGYYYDLLDALGIESAPVIGHGFGGMIAAEMAAMCAHRISRLVLLAPLGLWMEETPSPDPFTMGVSGFAAHAFNEPGSDAAAPYVIPAGTPQSSEVMVERTKSLASLGKYIWPLPDKGLKKRMHRIKAPTLILWGEADRLVPAAYGQAFASRLPDARLEVIPGGSHMLIVEQPQAFAEATLAFLGA
jgi:pimeloyl-ACP methyl ester carboxylesterase